MVLACCRRLLEEVATGVMVEDLRLGIMVGFDVNKDS
jgi:hypothetical protein